MIGSSILDFHAVILYPRFDCRTSHLKTVVLVGRGNAVLASILLPGNELAGLHLDWHILKNLPLPIATAFANEPTLPIVWMLVRLTLVHRRFAPEWLKLKSLLSQIDERNGSTGGP